MVWIYCVLCVVGRRQSVVVVVVVVVRSPSLVFLLLSSCCAVVVVISRWSSGREFCVSDASRGLVVFSLVVVSQWFVVVVSRL